MTAGRKSTSIAKDWCTPKKYTDVVRAFYGGQIDLDPCSNAYSLVCATTNYILPVNDGLRDSWDFERIYVNPPYGRSPETKTSIAHWIKRCSKANVEHGAEVIALIPSATNTKHWQNVVFRTASVICFLMEPRIKFFKEIDGDNEKGAPMACSLVYWGARTEEFKTAFSGFGSVLFTGVF